MITLDELLERDKKREQDGFKRKIRIGRIVKPGSGGKEKIIVVPTTVEEKFVHDDIFCPTRNPVKETPPAAPGKAKKAKSSVNSRCGRKRERARAKGTEKAREKARAGNMKWKPMPMNWARCCPRILNCPT